MRFKSYFGFILLIAIFLVSQQFVFGQPKLKKLDRIKDFGKSLKRYEKREKRNTVEPQEQPDENDEETIRVKTDLVVNDILVVNQKGSIIADLKQGDFLITEDGVPQEIGLFAFGEDARIPRSVVLIFDYSTSLLPYINNSTEAAKALVDKLGPGDRMAIVTDDVKLAVDFTKDKVLLKSTLDVLNKNTLKVKGGKSRQYSALLAVLNEMFDDEDVRPIVILQSDGDEIPGLKRGAGEYPISGSLRSGWERMYGKRAFGYGDLTSAVERSRATIYSIIPGIRLLGFAEAEQTKRVEIMLANLLRKIVRNDYELQNAVRQSLMQSREEFLAGQDSMFEIANLSGGHSDYIEKPEDAETVYSTMFTVINNRYVIGYYPRNEIYDGKRRNVKIQVKGHPEYIIVGRKSYFAPVD